LECWDVWTDKLVVDSFFTILLSGVLGGFARYQWDKTEENAKAKSSFSFMVVGIAAAFLVPLFLNSISSNLIKETESDPSKFFIVIGFCIAASMYAKKFIDSVAREALKDSKKAIAESKEAKGLANEAKREAKREAKDAESDARSADNRAIALYEPLKLIDSQKFEEALSELESVIAFDPKNSEAWAWKAYCLKHKQQPNFPAAVGAIETALRLEGKEVYSWLYNLACYKCLAKADVSEVIAVLERIKATAIPGLIALVGKDLKQEKDFASIRQEVAFVTFLDSF
jgi:tetratricopeptide (TPR) repeat protein